MTGRYVEVNMDETNEILRMSCPACKYPMRVLGKHEHNIYHCYCAACQTDRYMKDTLDAEKLTFKEFDRGMKRGKGIDLEQISDLVYELYDEKEQLTKELNKLKKFEYGGEHIRLSINIETGELQRHIYATGQWFGDFDRVLVDNWLSKEDYQRFINRVIEVYNTEFKKELEE